jgi:DNA modification methylase
VVFGSPPYAEKGERYGEGSKRWKTESWIDWMLEVTQACLQVSNGYVIWVVNGAVRVGNYLPACEGLVWKCHQARIICERPCIWHKNAPPNRKDWFGNDWEYVLVFKSKAKGLHFDWKEIAQPPKYTAGGKFRQRNAKGKRVEGNAYPKNKLARPRDVIRCTVGGGHMGSPLAHGNEAPFPESLADHFIRTCCPPGGVVLDPFSGSGTTGAVAVKSGRRYIGIDVRHSQVNLSRKRLK